MYRKVVAVDVKAPSDVFDCSLCGGAGPLTCSSCKSIKYCGTRCQAAQWPAHKAICRKIKEYKTRMAVSASKVDVDVFGEIWPNAHNYHSILNQNLTDYMEVREELTQCLIMCGLLNNSKLAQELAIEHNLDFLYIMGIPPINLWNLDLVFTTLIELGRYAHVPQLTELHSSCVKSLQELDAETVEETLNNPHLDPSLYLYIAEVEQLRAFRETMYTLFWTLMLGTHPRVGADSPVRRIRGCTPVIEGIRVHLLEAEQSGRRERIKLLEQRAIRQTYRLQANYLRIRGESLVDQLDEKSTTLALNHFKKSFQYAKSVGASRSVSRATSYASAFRSDQVKSISKLLKL